MKREMSKAGMVSLVGAGPGAWELMTLGGLKRLRECDAVVYDHLASDRFLALLREGCRKIYVGKQSGSHSMKQEEINNLLIELAGQGLKVVRLKGGDPFVFGRGGEEIQALKEHGISWELVPGVTSAVAVPEMAGIPVTHRGVSRSFHVITGHTKEQGKDEVPDMTPYAKLPGTLVFLMGLKQLPEIADRLIAAGKNPDTPAAVIEKGTLKGQRAVRASLEKLAERARAAKIGTPAVIIVGDTAAFDMSCSFDADCREKESAAEELSLNGVRIAVTGTSSFTVRLKTALENKGALTETAMELKLVSFDSSQPVNEAYKNLKAYTWIGFTSANGVRLFFDGLFRRGLDCRALGSCRFAVIGDGTAGELLNHGFRPDLMPEIYSAGSLGENLASALDKEDRILIARSRSGSKELTEPLCHAGLSYDDVAFYDVEKEGAILPCSFIPDYLTFASASGVRAFFGCGHPLLKDGRMEKIRLVCIGQATAAALSEFGVRPDVIAGKFDIQGLVDAICRDFHNSRL